MNLRTVGQELTKTDYKVLLLAAKKYQKSLTVGVQLKTEIERAIEKLEGRV